MSTTILRSLLPFQSTLPVWGATFAKLNAAPLNSISIHAPRVGSDPTSEGNARGFRHFNPRSPCGERHLHTKAAHKTDRFQSTLPVWGATMFCYAKRLNLTNFNPRSPCGERQQRCTDFSFASSAKRVFFVIFSKLGAVFRGSAEKGGGISFLDRCEPPGGNMGTWRSRSENQGVFGRIGGFTAKVFYFLFVLIAKVVES